MLTVEANFSTSYITCLWICVSESVCVQASSLCAYFCVFMSWAEEHRPRIWEGISVGHLLVNTFVITPRQRWLHCACSVVLSDPVCQPWLPMRLSLALSLSAWCSDRGDRGAAKATCQVWGESCISCLVVQRGNWLRFIGREYTESDVFY